MASITGVVEKKVAESVWAYLREWLTRCRDLRKQNEMLQAQLAEERSPRVAFEKLMSEVQCDQEDESIYWRKDGNGGPYCPVCLHDNQKLIPMTHADEGAFYCCLHKQYFRTRAFRERERNRPQPQQPSYGGPHSWMAR